jgi:hypothetical protein
VAFGLSAVDVDGLTFSTILPLWRTFSVQGAREVVNGVQSLAMTPHVVQMRCKCYRALAGFISRKWTAEVMQREVCPKLVTTVGDDIQMRCSSYDSLSYDKAQQC